MTRQAMRMKVRCRVCLGRYCRRPNGTLQRHQDCPGSHQLPLPTPYGMELEQGPFPDDVRRVVDARGVAIMRTPHGWFEVIGNAYRGLVLRPAAGPYMVTAVNMEAHLG